MTIQMKSRLTAASVILGTLLAGPALAEIDATIECDKNNLCIDIASDKAGGERPIEPGSYTLKIVNVMPSKTYRVNVQTSTYMKIPDEIKLPTSKSPTTAAMTEDEKAQDAKCEAAVKTLNNLYAKAPDESTISGLNQVLSVTLADCGAKATTYKQAFLIKTTKVISPSTVVVDQQQLKVVVERVTAENATAKVEETFGTYTFSTPRKPGQWLVYYGVNYIFADNEEYFAKANPNTAPPTYTVTEKSDVGGGTYAPSLYFMYFDSTERRGWRCALSCNRDDVFWGITAGIGFDFDNPTAFLGYGVGWGYNLLLTAGVAMAKVTRLAGQYDAGDVITEALTEKQLSDETYEPYPYVGVAFRFGGNPFPTKASTSAPTPPATPAVK